MINKIYKTITGYIEVEISGKLLDVLINECVRSNISIWNIKKIAPDKMRWHMTPSQYKNIRMLLKKTGSRSRIIKRSGLPFTLHKWMRRKFLMVGVALFVLGIYINSAMIWNVEVNGNENIHTDQILEAADELGLHRYQFKFRLDDVNEIAAQLMQMLPDTSWIGVEMKGTKLKIEVVESILKEQKELKNPRHFVAKHDAVITEIFAERGSPKVRPNMRVKQGDILISGVLGDEENNKIVVAEGKVRGLVWYEYDIAIPLEQKVKTYTGNSDSNKYVRFGDWTLKIWGFGGDEFKTYESDLEYSTLSWRNYSLPFGILNETVRESQSTSNKISLEEARERGLQEAKAELIQYAGTDAEIITQNILHQKQDNVKVYMKVFFEVEQDIVVEQTIIETTPEQGE
ncbi:sporulation protein YqfD [Longirhabdus pacifica]|uniref:sporulation protein YqfD n=1 Tax=Longirhabdus pacifica TaxID=2305227 RepID=UPI001008EAF2|nr:sporulation protein YqfD [Longirhabdus pacifica]